MIPYSHQTIEEDDIQAVVNVLRSDTIARGSKITEFEEALAKYCNAEYAVAFSSGTAALHAACEVIGDTGLYEDDEIITTPLTFTATAFAPIYNNSKPIFVDVNPETLYLDPNKVEEKININTKAIIPVDFAGLPCSIETLIEITRYHNLSLIFDSCHSLGAKYKDGIVGQYADMSCFSFHPVKAITTGEGGAVTTNNFELCKKLLRFRAHGIERITSTDYNIIDIGYNYWMSDIQAALGLSQLSKIERFLARRRQIAKMYHEELSDLVWTQAYNPDSAWHLFVIQVPNRDKVLSKLREAGIGSTIHYKPLHLHPYFQQRYGYKKGDFPVAENYYEHCLSLPIYPSMTDKQVWYVIVTLRKILQ